MIQTVLADLGMRILSGELAAGRFVGNEVSLMCDQGLLALKAEILGANVTPVYRGEVDRPTLVAAIRRSERGPHERRSPERE